MELNIAAEIERNMSQFNRTFEQWSAQKTEDVENIHVQHHTNVRAREGRFLFHFVALKPPRYSSSSIRPGEIQKSRVEKQKAQDRLSEANKGTIFKLDRCANLLPYPSSMLGFLFLSFFSLYLLCFVTSNPLIVAYFCRWSDFFLISFQD